MDTMTRLSFYDRLHRFVADRALRDDWKDWMTDTRAAAAVWDRVWPRARVRSEHDSALFLILLAVCAFEGRPVRRPARLLAQIPDREVELKTDLAARGYLHFTAFDRDPGRPSRSVADV